jgi:hypothetical protein
LVRCVRQGVSPLHPRVSVIRPRAPVACARARLLRQQHVHLRQRVVALRLHLVQLVARHAAQRCRHKPVGVRAWGQDRRRVNACAARRAAPRARTPAGSPACHPSPAAPAALRRAAARRVRRRRLRLRSRAPRRAHTVCRFIILAAPCGKLRTLADRRVEASRLQVRFEVGFALLVLKGPRRCAQKGMRQRGSLARSSVRCGCAARRGRKCVCVQPWPRAHASARTRARAARRTIPAGAAARVHDARRRRGWLGLPTRRRDLELKAPPA